MYYKQIFISNIHEISNKFDDNKSLITRSLNLNSIYNIISSHRREQLKS